jgi:hypothetical protein
VFPKNAKQTGNLVVISLVGVLLLIIVFAAIGGSRQEPSAPQTLTARRGYVCVRTIDELTSLAESNGSVFGARAMRMIQDGDGDVIKAGDTVQLYSASPGVAIVDTQNMRGCFVPASVFQ